MAKTIKVKVKLREFTYGKPGGGYKTVAHTGEVELTPEVQAAIDAGFLEVVQEEPKAQTQASQPTQNLEDMTMAELRDLAHSMGLDTKGIRKKADLIALIQEAQGGE